MITVEKADAVDVMYFVTHIRPKDAEEVFYCTGCHIEDMIGDIFVQNPQAIKCDGRLIGLGGWYELPETRKDNGVCGWILLTTDVEKHKMAFLKWSKKYVDNLLKTYNYIENDVYRGNKLHIDYLKWLGAKFKPLLKRKEFLRFRIERR